MPSIQLPAWMLGTATPSKIIKIPFKFCGDFETVAPRHAFLGNYNPYSLQHTRLFQIFIASSSNTMGSSAEHEGNRDRRSFFFFVWCSFVVEVRAVVTSMLTRQMPPNLALFVEVA